MILIDSKVWAYHFHSTLSEPSQVVKSLESCLEKGEAAVNSQLQSKHFNT